MKLDKKASQFVNTLHKKCQTALICGNSKTAVKFFERFPSLNEVWVIIVSDVSIRFFEKFKNDFLQP